MTDLQKLRELAIKVSNFEVYESQLDDKVNKNEISETEKELVLAYSKKLQEERREQEDKQKKEIKKQNGNLKLLDALKKYIKQPRKQEYKTDLSKELTEEYNLFVVQDENKKWNCYREINNTYTQIDITDLTNLIRDTTSVELAVEPKEIEHMLNTITRRLKFDNNYYELQNHMLYLNPSEKEKIKIIPKEQCKNIKTRNFN